MATAIAKPYLGSLLSADIKGDKKILGGLFLASKSSTIKSLFSSASSLLTSGKIKKLSDLAKYPKFAGIVKKFTPGEQSAYMKHLVPLGFPALAVAEGRITGFLVSETRATVTARKISQSFGVSDKKVIKTLDQHIKFLSADTFFQKIHKKAKQMNVIGRSRASREWYYDQALEQGVNYRSMNMLRTGGKRVTDIRLGRMYFFRYRPEKPEDMYDEFPLIFLLYEDPDNFAGINFHYLRPKLRAVLLGNMMMYLNNQDYTDRTKLFARKFRNMIQTNRRFRHAKVIYRQYSIEDVQSKIIQVHPLDWELAITVPTERFKTIGGGRTMSKKMWIKTEKLAKKA